MQQDLIQEMVLSKRKFGEIKQQLEKKFGEQALKKTAIYEWMKKANLGLPMRKESSMEEMP